jgi:hypothetical protein
MIEKRGIGDSWIRGGDNFRDDSATTRVMTPRAPATVLFLAQLGLCGFLACGPVLDGTDDGELAGEPAVLDDPGAELVESADALVCPTRTPNAGVHADVLAAFSAQQTTLEALVNPSAPASFTTNDLYNLQLQTAPVLRYATYYRDIALVERLARLYDRAWPFLRAEHRYMYFYLCRNGSCPRQTDVAIAPARMWTNAPLAGSAARYELLLDSSQFAYPITRIVSFVSGLPPAQRTPPLVAFVKRWVPFLSTDHFARRVLGRPGEPGIYQRAGWGCGHGNFTLLQHLENVSAEKYGTSALPAASAKSYCNTLTDEDLWNIAGVAELLMAAKADPVLVNVPAATLTGLTRFFRLGDSLMARRTKATALVSASGAPTSGRLFQAGDYDDHPDHQYAGDTGPTFPGWKVAGQPAARRPRPANGTGWDPSHGRRLVNVLDTLRRATTPLNTSWPSRADMVGFARQVAWGFGRKLPNGSTRFTNYMDGTNGWYRVNYSNRPGFGYAPYAMSEAVPSSGYGVWGAYEPATLATIKAYVREVPPTEAQRLMVAPSLVPLSSEPGPCP